MNALLTTDIIKETESKRQNAKTILMENLVNDEYSEGDREIAQQPNPYFHRVQL